MATGAPLFNQSVTGKLHDQLILFLIWIGHDRSLYSREYMFGGYVMATTEIMLPV